ncbi:MAG: hypothetical protein QOI05_361 [Bradyrhizobium sp.]|nr:hypothetical protein [Bradyrhizobium sp.]
MSDDDIEVIPPSRSNLPARRSGSSEVAPRRASTAPVRVRPPSGIIPSALVRMEARRESRTYDALTTRTNAERSLVEADTALGNALIKNARMRHEYDELPRTLAVDRAKREIKRVDEVRDAYHQFEMAEHRRATERAHADVTLTDARTGLTTARERLTMARKGLLNADQELEAQRQNGSRYHDLEWQRKIGERELYVEEQQAVLAEHRRRTGGGTGDTGDLYQARDEMNADGRDTRAVDLEIERNKARSRK